LPVLALTVAGVLALSAPMVADAIPLGSDTGPAASCQTPGVVQVRDDRGSSWHSAPGHLRQWHGGVAASHWRQNWNGGWVPYSGPTVPTYWVWGPSGGAFDYPFADWRGPSGGWGNP
jgi:hypothetical protein